jgi:streptogrisin B
MQPRSVQRPLPPKSSRQDNRHQATTSTVSPGDEIVHVAADGPHRCTLGYTFTNAARRTYGITAGHCGAGTEPNVSDRTTGATGQFVLTVTPDDEPFQDYGLIDFGASRSIPIIKGMSVTGVALPDNRNAICHTGISTGVAFGQLADDMLINEYLATGMAPSIPGDSGGPVWQLNADATSATVVGRPGTGRPRGCWVRRSWPAPLLRRGSLARRGFPPD